MTLTRKTPMKRTATKRKPRRNESEIEFRGEQKEAVERRSGGKCEAQSRVCTGKARVIHHRLMKSQGGRGDAGNGLHCCSACHVYMHQHRPEAAERGWILRRLPADGVDTN